MKNKIKNFVTAALMLAFIGTVVFTASLNLTSCNGDKPAINLPPLETGVGLPTISLDGDEVCVTASASVQDLNAFVDSLIDGAVVHTSGFDLKLTKDAPGKVSLHLNACVKIKKE